MQTVNIRLSKNDDTAIVETPAGFVRIVAVKQKGGSTHIRIECPDDLTVHRGESAPPGSERWVYRNGDGKIHPMWKMLAPVTGEDGELLGVSDVSRARLVVKTA